MLAFGPQMKSADYLATNPMGEVPVSEHGEAIFTEVAACRAYLASTFPERRLSPAPGTVESTAYHRWMFFAAGPCETAPTNVSLGLHVPDSPQARGRSGYGLLHSVIDTLRGIPGDGRDYITGNSFSGADDYLGSPIQWGVKFGFTTLASEIEEYLHRLTSRPAAIRARALDEALLSSQD